MGSGREGRVTRGRDGVGWGLKDTRKGADLSSGLPSLTVQGRHRQSWGTSSIITSWMARLRLGGPFCSSGPPLFEGKVEKLGGREKSRAGEWVRPSGVGVCLLALIAIFQAELEEITAAL